MTEKKKLHRQGNTAELKALFERESIKEEGTTASNIGSQLLASFNKLEPEKKKSEKDVSRF